MRNEFNFGQFRKHDGIELMSMEQQVEFEQLLIYDDYELK